MSILDKIESTGQKSLTWVEHAAAYLVGKVAQAETNLNTLEADNPLVKEAIDAGVAKANALGIPVNDIENAATAVLQTAQDLANNLTTPAAPTPAPAPNPDPGASDPNTGAGTTS
jgi:hypothetical protein